MNLPNQKTIVAIVILAVLAAMVVWVGNPLVPFVLAVVLAYIWAPVVDHLERWRVRRAVGATIVVLAMLALLIVAPLVLLPLFIIQLSSAIDQVPAFFERGTTWLFDRIPSLATNIPTNWSELTGMVDLAGSDQLARLGSWLSWFGEGISALFTFLGVLVIAPLVTFYLLRDWPKLLTKTSALLPAAIKPAIVTIFAIADQALGQFLRGQLSVMAIMAVIYSVLLAIAGTPSALAVGVVTGLLCFIPYLGFILGLILALAVSLANFSGWDNILATLVAMVVGTLLEGFVITPRIIGGNVGLGPVAVLLALTIMGSAFGFVGILFAIPLASVLLALWRYYFMQSTSSGDAV